MAGGVQEHQVGTGTGGDAADVGAAEGGGAARGGGPEGLVGGHPHVPYGQGDAERHGRGERRAGIAVRGERDRGPRVEQAAGVGPGGAGGELGAGEEGGDRVPLAQRVDVGVGEMGAVVGRGGVELHGELDAGAVRQLVGVDTGVEPFGAARGEDGAGLVAVEGAALAEDVDPAGVRGAGVQHRAGDQVDVAGRVVGVVRGDDVGAEVGDLVGVAGGDAQGAGLVLDREAVAGLGLQGGGALPQSLREVVGDVVGELLVGGLAGGGDRGADAARGVGLPGHPGVELLGAVAREDQVGVGVDEARDHGPARRVEDVVSGGCFA